MSKVTIYGKKSAVALETINDVEEHYCTNGMFYVRAEGQEYYFSLEAIGMIRVETESEEQESILDKIKEEIRDNTYFINEITEKEGIDFETVEKIINKYKLESEVEG